MPQVLDRSEDGVVIGGTREARSVSDETADQKRRDMPTGCERTTAVIRCPFVPSQEHEAMVTQRTNEPGNEAREIAITRCNRAIVHVVAFVGRDPHETR